MNELALFAGAGGGLLASDLLGWRTICAVEVDEYARSVLLARQNDRILRPFPIWDDVRTFDGKAWRGRVDVVSGGFPCQDISIARAMWGRAGIHGKKSSLWRQYLRIVDECEPAEIFGENSPELRRKGLDQIVRDLTGRGFKCRWITLGAGDLGLPHIRRRLWFHASHPDRARLEGYGRDESDQARRQEQERSAADAGLFLCPFCGYEMETDDRYGCPNCLGEGLECNDPWQELLPRITGMGDGVANWVDRHRAVGNGQVPEVAFLAYRLLTAC